MFVCFSTIEGAARLLAITQDDIKGDNLFAFSFPPSPLHDLVHALSLNSSQRPSKSHLIMFLSLRVELTLTIPQSNLQQTYQKCALPSSSPSLPPLLPSRPSLQQPPPAPLKRLHLVSLLALLAAPRKLRPPLAALACTYLPLLSLSLSRPLTRCV